MFSNVLTLHFAFITAFNLMYSLWRFEFKRINIKESGQNFLLFLLKADFTMWFDF